MLVAKKRIICTPYRVKAKKLDKHIYTVEFKEPKNIPILPGGLVELEAGPTGLMLIDRVVFERIITNHPNLKIKNKATPTADKSHEFYTTSLTLVLTKATVREKIFPSADWPEEMILQFMRTLNPQPGTTDLMPGKESLENL